jgi:hypothetical protein
MPARNVTRCRPRSTVELDPAEERNCIEWIPVLPHSQFRTLSAMRAVWDRHGAALLRHYVRQRPGTRPFALYALGELPLPALRHQPKQHALRTVIEGITYYDPWHYYGTRTGDDGWYCGGSTWGEFQHLRHLGVIDDAEAKLADQWIDDRRYDPDRDRRYYQPMSQFTLTPGALAAVEIEERT